MAPKKNTKSSAKNCRDSDQSEPPPPGELEDQEGSAARPLVVPAPPETPDVDPLPGKAVCPIVAQAEALQRPVAAKPIVDQPPAGEVVGRRTASQRRPVQVPVVLQPIAEPDPPITVVRRGYMARGRMPSIPISPETGAISKSPGASARQRSPSSSEASDVDAVSYTGEIRMPGIPAEFLPDYSQPSGASSPLRGFGAAQQRMDLNIPIDRDTREYRLGKCNDQPSILRDAENALLKIMRKTSIGQSIENLQIFNRRREVSITGVPSLHPPTGRAPIGKLVLGYSADHFTSSLRQAMVYKIGTGMVDVLVISAKALADDIERSVINGDLSLWMSDFLPVYKREVPDRNKFINSTSLIHHFATSKSIRSYTRTVIYAAYKRRVPVICPNIMDFMSDYIKPELMDTIKLNILEDYANLLNEVKRVDILHGIVLGDDIVKDFIIDAFNAVTPWKMSVDATFVSTGSNPNDDRRPKPRFRNTIIVADPNYVTPMMTYQTIENLLHAED